jgi:hypothetical protein
MRYRIVEERCNLYSDRRYRVDSRVYILGLIPSHWEYEKRFDTQEDALNWVLDRTAPVVLGEYA